MGPERLQNASDKPGASREHAQLSYSPQHCHTTTLAQAPVACHAACIQGSSAVRRTRLGLPAPDGAAEQPHAVPRMTIAHGGCMHRQTASQHLLVLLSRSSIGKALLAHAVPLGIHALHTKLGVSALGLQQR